MVVVKNFVYCLGTKTKIIKEGETPITIIDGVLNCLTPDFVPGNYSFSLSFSLLNLEPEKKYKVVVRFIDTSSQKELVKVDDIVLDGNIENRNKVGIPKEYFGYNVGIELRNVILEKEGIYQTILYVDGEEAGRYPIYVKGKRIIENG